MTRGGPCCLRCGAVLVNWPDFCDKCHEVRRKAMDRDFLAYCRGLTDSQLREVYRIESQYEGHEDDAAAARLVAAERGLNLEE